ncbi:MAG: leucyl aminopeptidase [Thermoleophilaceae bacterium]|jgi:leucyl aminopeptidase|nr:leucyl aminopeptidase [Thermoleophilaceae bacterium]MEA2437236.1 leucyl aminopeptidase [Thermoleophilaceae bacterium]
MPQITVSARRGAPEETSADTRVIGLFEGESLPEGPLRGLSDSGEASGKPRKLAVAHEDSRRVIVVGLGKRDEFDSEAARVAAAVAAGRARELSAKSLSWEAPSGAGVAGALVEGTLLALYKFDRFKSSSGSDAEDDAAELESLEVASADADVSAMVERAAVTASAQNAARDLQNLPSNVATPSFLASRAEEVAGAHSSLSFEALGPDEIASREMGAFMAVAQGSDTEPRLIVLRYDGGGPHLGYVGKAVTFDTGGISIKPSAKMHEMKFDMSGGAAVIEAMGAIAALSIPVRITAVVPSTENMPSGHAMKPGDIVTASNGKTIEINNTDAEGRLILADALAFAVAEGAERIVDLATLTGAIVIALGSTYAGLFSNDDDWCREVEAASSASGELGWRMPLHPEFFDLTKGQYADLTNASDQRKASSSYAAEFLRQFVDDRPWVHVDIAGTAWGQGRVYNGSGASGFGVRMLVELAQRAADAARGG